MGLIRIHSQGKEKELSGYLRMTAPGITHVSPFRFLAACIFSVAELITVVVIALASHFVLEKGSVFLYSISWDVPHHVAGRFFHCSAMLASSEWQCLMGPVGPMFRYSHLPCYRENPLI